MQADPDGDGACRAPETTSSGAERSGQWSEQARPEQDGYLSRKK
jgi:hypothetical protein